MRKFLLPCSRGICCAVLDLPQVYSVEWAALQSHHWKRSFCRDLPAAKRAWHRSQAQILKERNHQTKPDAWTWEKLLEAYKET